MIDSNYDALIVLGSSLNSDNTVPDVDKRRLEKAAQLHSKLNLPIIVCGGRGYKLTESTDLSEAEAYANYLISLGVSEDSVYLETESQESLGNILFAKMHILQEKGWRALLVIPTRNHSTERIAYLLKKILGNDYSWDITRVGENRESNNVAREAKALSITIEINDQFADGDHEAIYAGLLETHPAYGGTKWTLEELREKMKH